MKKVLINLRLFIAVLAAASFVSACDNDKPLSDNEYVNNWILKNMNSYYLWNNEIPARPNKNQKPNDFFYSLLSNKDRFSWIQDNYQELLKSLQGINMEAGYEFVLYRESKESQVVIAQVVYIKPNSPAAATVLKRGDKITRINGQLITVSNYQSLLGQLSNNHTITYERYNFETEVFEVQPQLALTVVEFSENPNFMHTVFDYPGKKVGYYVYNFFASGVSETGKEYDNEMAAIFADFKTQGITDLVLDLRYNSGGSETSTIKLASLIAPGVTTTNLFTRWEYNQGLTNYLQGQYGSSFFLRNFSNEANNIGPLNGNRLYVLTRNRTASASELIINGLRPYMEVFIIGDTTVGKNVGSISIYEENDRRNKWGMQPIIVKSYNKNNESDYDEGFIPNLADKDNNLVILPLGDPQENLLSKALEQITGSEGGRKKLVQVTPWGQMVGSSLDRKRKNFNVLLEDERLRDLAKTID
jgi:carboxyl-terminal processing protease